MEQGLEPTAGTEKEETCGQEYCSQEEGGEMWRRPERMPTSVEQTFISVYHVPGTVLRH